MPPTEHHRHEVPLFDLIMGEVVPTLSTLAVETRGTSEQRGATATTSDRTVPAECAGVTDPTLFA